MYRSCSIICMLFINVYNIILLDNIVFYLYYRSRQVNNNLIQVRRLAARDNWPPISWVDWPPNEGQLAAGLIMLMTSERPV